LSFEGYEPGKKFHPGGHTIFQKRGHWLYYDNNWKEGGRRENRRTSTTIRRPGEEEEKLMSVVKIEEKGKGVKRKFLPP